MISLLVALLLAGCQPKEEKRSDTDFEGSITYKLVDWDSKDMDSAEIAEATAFFPKEATISYFDEGSFLSILNGKVLEYSYFNRYLNKEFNKFSKVDSLYVVNCGKELDWQGNLLDVAQEYNTDTILGHACNRLIMKYTDRTETYLFSPDFPTNPEWYKHSTGNDYDILYRSMKAYYLSMRIESKKYAFTVRAVKIVPGKVPINLFPKVDKLPHRNLN
jgi:hypothetical protein